jgi:hypothetical protein
MAITLESPGTHKTLQLFDPPNVDDFINELGDREHPSDPSKKIFGEAFDEALQRYNEKLANVQLIFRRVLDTVYTPWPWALQAVAAKERADIISMREAHKSDPDHHCHGKYFRTIDSQLEERKIERDILDACLVGCNNIGGFENGVARDEETRQRLIDSLLMNRLGGSASMLAMQAQGLGARQSLF